MKNRRFTYKKRTKPISVSVLSSKSVGWFESKKSKISKLINSAKGLRDRIDSISNNSFDDFEDNRFVPCCYKSDMIFNPDTENIFSDLFPSDGDLNYVIRDGRTYRKTIPIQSDGVFVARSISINLSHKIEIENVGEIYYNASNKSSGVSIPAYKDFKIIGSTSFTGPNFLWNMMNTSSGRMISDNFLSDFYLLNDSGAHLFEFDVPWIFERDSEIEFQFRSLNPVFQYDVSNPRLVYGINNIVNGKRDNSFRVRIEIHGGKFLTMQDAMRHGAKIWS